MTSPMADTNSADSPQTPGRGDHPDPDAGAGPQSIEHPATESETKSVESLMAKIYELRDAFDNVEIMQVRINSLVETCEQQSRVIVALVLEHGGEISSRNWKIANSAGFGLYGKSVTEKGVEIRIDHDLYCEPEDAS